MPTKARNLNPFKSNFPVLDPKDFILDQIEDLDGA